MEGMISFYNALKSKNKFLSTILLMLFSVVSCKSIDVKDKPDLLPYMLKPVTFLPTKSPKTQPCQMFDGLDLSPSLTTVFILLQGYILRAEDVVKSAGRPSMNFFILTTFSCSLTFLYILFFILRVE